MIGERGIPDCSAGLLAHCKDLGQLPLIDHNPRCGEKIEFDSAEAVRYFERTVAERMNECADQG